MGDVAIYISTSPNLSQNFWEVEVPVAEDERGLIHAFNLSLLFDKFGKVLVEIVTGIEAGSVEVGKHQFLLCMCCQTSVWALVMAALVYADQEEFIVSSTIVVHQLKGSKPRSLVRPQMRPKLTIPVPPGINALVAGMWL